MRIGIIGLGVVGRAQARMFSGHELVLYDPKEHDTYPARKLNQAAMAIIAVNTPPAADGSADLTNLHAAVHGLPLGVPAVIRSTVPPGTTDSLAGETGRLVCHVPEFMHERQGGAWPDSDHVPYMLLGGNAQALYYFRPLLKQVYGGKIHECSALEAELAKYTANLYWATRVTFVNEMARICEAFGADFEKVREAWLQDPRMYPAYTRWAGFPPGFGGACWPKDLSALIAASEKAGHPAEFLAAVREANARFTTDG